MNMFPNEYRKPKSYMRNSVLISRYNNEAAISDTLALYKVTNLHDLLSNLNFRIRQLRYGLVIWAIVLCPFVIGHAATYTLKNNVQVKGEPGRLTSIVVEPGTAVTPNPDVSEGIRSVLFTDDGLRRTFFSQFQVRTVAPSERENLESIKIDQRVSSAGKRLVSIGAIVRITPFDEYGRRSFHVIGVRGPMQIVQGITEITPRYTKLEALAMKNSIVWESRVSTTSISTNVLRNVLYKQLNMNDAGDRLRIVRLFMQAELYQDALVELQATLKQFPDLKNLDQQSQLLHQQAIERLISEIENRKEGGQHERVFKWLANFPTTGVAVETQLRARDLLKEFADEAQQHKRALDLFESLLEEVTDADMKKKIEPIHQEIKDELNLNTLNRMSDFLRLSTDDTISPESKLSMAISSWLLGAGNINENLAVSASLYNVRNAVREYLATDDLATRQNLLEKLRTLEGSSPANIAMLLQAMKPVTPYEMGETEVPGMYTISIDGLGSKPVEYTVQLPPDYDPYRSYPCIVALHAEGKSPVDQIQWWCGNLNKRMNMRMGQAGRYGYVVIAPKWTRDGKTNYGFTVHEHAAVLLSLRDALKKFSIDSDRVFLSGHSEAGTAAWDIGLAHPDLWAGVIPIVATAEKYIGRYWQNGRQVPFYFVMGEMDGNQLEINSGEFNRYLQRTGFDTMIVEYRGRGHEHFQDEIHHLMRWMRAHRRAFTPEKFTCSTLRPWDNFFFWVEVDDLPEDSIVMPIMWPKQNVRDVEVVAEIVSDNRIRVKTAANKITIYFTPDMIDFEQRVSIYTNSSNTTKAIVPSTEVMLEDVRTRCDRFHPFWAKHEYSRSR
ncbi:MAG TPA: peptidase [Planctomycetaceae bacterium]|jgi:predicted esterase|nr:peptidase [Planctomycetaceae bacterium]